MSPPPPPPPPPPPAAPIAYRQYAGGFTCSNYYVRNFAKNTEIRTDWACGAKCDGNATNTVCSCACQPDSSAARANTDKADRDAAADAEKQRLAAIAAAAAAAEAEKQRLAAIARAQAKAAAKALYDAAVVASNNAEATAKAARELWEKQKAEYTLASNAIPPAKLVYDNSQMTVDNAKTKKADFDDALAQQTAANALLATATDLLSKGNNTSEASIEKTFGENVAFMKNAADFANTTFGIEKEYNAMTADWTAFNAAKTALAATDSKKISEMTAATDKLVETYNTFAAAKTVYGIAVIKAMKTSSTDVDYIKTSKSEMDSLGLIYDISKEYTELSNAWSRVTKSLEASNVTETIINYNAYVPTKTAFTNALLLAQNKKAEADFQTSLAAGKDAVAKWQKSNTTGCRNLQTTATTDQNMLDQDIKCDDTEYISGYAKVSGFNAAPIDPNISRDNIGNYLAVKYSCCTAPSGAKGVQGKAGLPGLEGAPGMIGSPGPAGISGPTGKKGDTGDIGEEGGKGPMGDQGADGQDGEEGLPGKPGKTVKVPYIRQLPGPMGEKGKMGPRGQLGAKGPDGTNTPAPNYGFSELDRTIALLDVKQKADQYLRG